MDQVSSLRCSASPMRFSVSYMVMCFCTDTGTPWSPACLSILEIDS